MATQAVLDDPRREGAVVYHGQATCFSKAVGLLETFGLPNGILPLDEIEEVGYVEQTGFFWVKQKKKNAEHYFKVTKTLCSYGKEISGYFEKKGVKKLTGVKVKELLLWVSIVEISTDDSRPGQTYFKSSAGLGRWHPSEAFSLPNAFHEYTCAQPCGPYVAYVDEFFPSELLMQFSRILRLP